ncbi:MAG: isoaspartyl peptidase/L-asparaginase [Myxococcales bacterium]|nr:isoaspartyl peptidase/L-asparaginase [Myxococcales bacterium]
MKQPPIIVIHGGAGTIAPDLREAALAGVAAAARRGQAMLAAGAGAVDVAVAAVRLLEDDPTFNAGRGACLTADGEVEVDAGIMRSRDRRSGALAGVRNLRDPINVARRVMEATRHSLLVGEGAESFARAQGLGAFGRHEVETAKAVERWRRAKAGEAAIDNRADTVGAVVLDAAGELCAAGSTGGVLLKLPGRVGDTPLVGAGFYADPELGACCCTGVGEAIMARVLAFTALREVAAAPADAQAIAERLCDACSAEHGGAAVGLILARPDGAVAIAHRSQHMSWGLAIGEGAVVAGLDLAARRLDLAGG